MTCREFADFLDDFLAGQLAPDVGGSFQRHLAICVNCRRYLDQYRQTVAVGRAAFADADAPVPHEIPEDLVAAILAARQS